MLPLFNLTAEIECYNRFADVKCMAAEDFGVRYFRSDVLQSVNATIQLINEGLEQDHFTEEEVQSTYQKKERLLAIHRRLKSKQPTQPNSVAVDPIVDAQLNAKYHAQQWSRFQQQLFAKEENWQQWRLITDSINARAITETKMYWDKHQVFACHSHVALLQATMDFLPKLIAHHEQAVKKFAEMASIKQIPTPIWRSYRNYLNDFLQKAKAAQEQIAESMFARLNAWDVGEHNLFTHLIHTLQKNDVVLTHPYLPLPKQEALLTAQQFSVFHHTIERYGNADLKRRLHTLSWFTQQSILSTSTIKTRNNFLLVPTALANQIPNRRRSPGWLFKGANLRHDFFNDKGHLLAMLKKSPHIDALEIKVNNVASMEQILTHIHTQEQLAQQALDECQQQSYPSLSKIWHRQTRRFLGDWQGLLKQHRLTQLQNKVMLAENLAQALLQTQSPTRSAAVTPWQTCHFLRRLLEEIQTDFKKTHLLDAALTNRVTHVQQKTATMLACNRAYVIIQQAAENYRVTEIELSYLFDYVASLQLKDGKLAADFISVCGTFLENITSALHYEFKNYAFQTEDKQLVEDCSNRVLGLNAIIMRLGTPTQNQVITQQIQKYFLRYLRAHISFTSATNPLHTQLVSLEAAETLILMLGKNISYAGKSLANYVEEIRQKRIRGATITAGTQCLALAKQLANEQLQERFCKDVQLLDNNISKYLLSSHSIDGDSSHLSVLLRIRDEAIKQKKPLEELTLTKSEQVLVGLTHSETAPIKLLLTASIEAHQTKATLQANKFDLEEKSLCIRELSQRLDKTFANTAFTHTPGKQLLKAPLGQRTLFAKCYLEKVLVDKNTSQSLPQHRA